MGRANEYEQKRAAFAANKDRNVFVIMRYESASPFTEIEAAIKAKLVEYNFIPVVARELTLDDELWSNVQFCMEHCRYAIAVFERVQQTDYNPNVTLELGYMLALERHCLILKDKEEPTLNTDIIGRLYSQIDMRDVSQTVGQAVESWLINLGHGRFPSATTITGPNHTEANKLRTQTINEALERASRQTDKSGRANIIRQAASLSSLAISDHEIQQDADFHSLIKEERDAIIRMLSGGWTIRVIVCPESQIEWAELKLISGDEVSRKILPRYDNLISMIKKNMQNERLQITYMLRIPHDNLLIIDDTTVFVARRRHRDSGFPYTTRIFDPVVICDEGREFDALFADSVGAILRKESPEESDFGSTALKKMVVKKLKNCKRRLRKFF